MARQQDQAKATGQKGIREVKGLFEDSFHLVTTIPAEADEGEDLLISFKEQGTRTGDSILIQVKSGASYQTKDGYFIPIGQHLDSWLKNKIPVYGIVYDPEAKAMFWVNISDFLWHHAGTNPSRIPVLSTNELSEATLDNFVRSTSDYISSTGSMHKLLSELLSIETGLLSNSDYLSYFMNAYGERAVFQQKLGEEKAVLYHEDISTDGSFRFSADDVKIEYLHNKHPLVYQEGEPQYTIADSIMDSAEAMWLIACLQASVWWKDINLET